MLTFAALPVGRVYPRGMNPDPHFAEPGTGRLDIDDLQHIKAAIFLKFDRPHRCATPVVASIDANGTPLARWTNGDGLGDAGRTIADARLTCIRLAGGETCIRLVVFRDGVDTDQGTG